MLDLLVAGGGPVGLATALYARRAGLSVEVAEPRRGPIDKACGEGLMPGAVAALKDLDVALPGHPIRGIRYIAGRRTARAEFQAGYGMGVRRTALHDALSAAVRREGIVVHRRAVGPVRQDADAVSAGDVTARYLAAADGLHSPIRRSLELDGATPPRARFGLRAHFEVAPWADVVEVHWATETEAYVTPVSSDLVGVAILTRRRAPFAEQLRSFPQLLERLDGAPCSHPRGAGPLRQRSRSKVCGRVLLVGDAAGYVDALTGEGISVGLATARELVRAVVSDDPQPYESAWLAATRHYRFLTGSLLWAGNRRLLRPAIVPSAHYLPGVFAAAVNRLAR